MLPVEVFKLPTATEWNPWIPPALAQWYRVDSWFAWLGGS